MKSSYLSLLLSILFFTGAQAQNAVPTKYTTNYTNSNIRFEYLMPQEVFQSPVILQRGGTCWACSASSFLEAEALRMSKKQVNLSERYVLFMTYLAKARNYLERDGKTQFSEGGEFWDVLYVLKNFGLMPETAMPWEPAPNIDKMHDKLLKYIDYLLAYHNIHERYPQDWEAGYKAILEQYLGRVPATFMFEDKPHTPQSFAKALQLNAAEYVNFICDSKQVLYEPVVVPFADNWYGGTAINLPFDVFCQLPAQVIRQGGTIEWSTDVSSAEWNFGMSLAAVHGKDTLLLSDAEKKNLWLNPIAEMPVTQTIRQAGLDEHSTEDDHGMHILALVADQQKHPYYLVKNSWGTNRNQCGGYLFASQEYLNRYTTMYSVHQSMLPEAVRKALKQ